MPPNAWFITSDGARLRRFAWSASLPKRARLLIVHGFGENGRRYGPGAGILAAAGIEIATYDHRGHGENAGKRGDVNPPALLERDLGEILKAEADDAAPLFLWGHSTGGQLIVNALSGTTLSLRGVILTAPWFRLSLEPPLWKQLAAHWLLRLAPGVTLATGLHAASLSRDIEYLRLLPGNERNHHRISSRVFDYLTRGGQRALDRAKSWTLPLLLAHGTDDPVTSIDASREFFANIPAATDKTFESFPEARHELQNDLCRDQLATLITDWIAARI